VRPEPHQAIGLLRKADPVSAGRALRLQHGALFRDEGARASRVHGAGSTGLLLAAPGEAPRRHRQRQRAQGQNQQVDAEQ
jgi:galactokinase/mevalonate kinase-like predicted kinase